MVKRIQFAGDARIGAVSLQQFTEQRKQRRQGSEDGRFSKQVSDYRQKQ